MIFENLRILGAYATFFFYPRDFWCSHMIYVDFFP